MGNRIPRGFHCIIAEQLTDTNAGKRGDAWFIIKDAFGNLIGTHCGTGREWLMSIGHLRNEHFYRIHKIA